ncbi:MAG: glutathione peroxidase [Candidatus Hydrogenedentales bacterium]|jgi:glutathione peroxidase
MSVRTALFGISIFCAGMLAPAFADDAAKSNEEKKMPDTVLGFEVKDIDGKDVKLGDAYAGKVLLIVNTASKCGFTPQYTDLEALYQKYHEKGFEILAFPSNNFGGQEPGSEAEIKEFCSTKFKVTFPLFSKVEVKGDAKVPLYQFLTDEKTNPASPGDVKWNFTKFLVGRDGKIIARYESAVKPMDDQVTKAVEDALAAEPAEEKKGA